MYEHSLELYMKYEVGSVQWASGALDYVVIPPDQPADMRNGEFDMDL